MTERTNEAAVGQSAEEAESGGFESEFDIQVSILRNGVEIGFCAALGSTIDHAAETIATLLQRREWETTAGMPDPSEVDQ